jgi:hypothetical protein
VNTTNGRVGDEKQLLSFNNRSKEGMDKPDLANSCYQVVPVTEYMRAIFIDNVKVPRRRLRVTLMGM